MSLPEPAGRWRVFFIDHPARRPSVNDDALAARFADRMAGWLETHGRMSGQPFVLDPDGRPDRRVNEFFSSHRMLALDADTWRKYALALGVWLNFLAQRGVSWDHAVAEDVEAFKYWRMTDATNPRRVAAGTVKGNLIALNVFYTWAAHRHGVTTPIVLRHSHQFTGGRHRSDGSVAANPAGARCRDLKWFTPAGYARWRDVGIRGFGLDGLEDPAWRGRNEQRDAAFADGLFATGLRLSEWASILVVELAPDDPARAYSTCWLADACAKGGRGRRFWLPRPALTKVLSYMEGARALAVRNAQHAGRYNQLADVRVVEGVHANRRLQLRDPAGSRVSVPLDALRPEEPLRLFRQPLRRAGPHHHPPSPRPARQPLPADIHPAEGMTCVYDPDKALCRLSPGLHETRRTPDLSDCHTGCQNIARTDRDIPAIHQRAGELARLVDDPLSPQPRRDRERHELARLQTILDEHDTTHPRPTP